MNEACFAACAATVRWADPDRYFSALFAPAEKRPFLFALYAFNFELARISESARPPILGQIRLQWWREAIAEARDKTPRRHDVVEAMGAVFSSFDLPLGLIDRMIDAREFDVSDGECPDYAALENYLDHTSSTLMRLAARILDVSGSYELAALHGGIAYGLTGIARSIALHAKRGKSFVPLTVLDAAGVARESVLAPGKRTALLAILREMATRATDSLRRAHIRAREVPFAAFLPAALVPLYARQVHSRSFDPMTPEVGLHRRLAAMLSAAMRRRI